MLTHLYHLRFQACQSWPTVLGWMLLLILKRQWTVDVDMQSCLCRFSFIHVIVTQSWISVCSWSTEEPANNSQATTQIISMLMVHKGYIFKLRFQQAQNWRSIREKRRNIFKETWISPGACRSLTLDVWSCFSEPKRILILILSPPGSVTFS